MAKHRTKQRTKPRGRWDEILVDPRKLVTNRVQLASRQDEPALKELQASMAEIGQLSKIVLKRRQNPVRLVVADGHRRRAVAIVLGWPTIEALIYEGPLSEAELWAALNAAARPLKGVDWFYAWAIEEIEGSGDAFLRRLKGTTANHIRCAVRVFGRNRAIEIGLTGKQSPVVASFANMVHAAIASRIGARMLLTETQIGEWLVEHGSSIRKLLATNPSKRTILRLHATMRRMKSFPVSEWDER